jgi:hypothetical protein
MNIGVPITSLLIAPASISISLAADTFSGNNWPFCELLYKTP